MSPSKISRQEPAPTEVEPSVLTAVKIAAIEALQSEGEVEVSEVLHSNKDATLVLIARLLAAAGIKDFSTRNSPEARTSKVAAPSAAALARLSPEQLATMATLRSRYETNANNIPCHKALLGPGLKPN